MPSRKRLISLLLVLLCVSLLVPASAGGVYASLLMRLSTRTGPGTQYDEPGTYFGKDWQTTQVEVVSAAWDDYNDIWWVQVDFMVDSRHFRAFTGLKRVAVDVSALPQDAPLGTAAMLSAAEARWGPGQDYVKSKYNVPKNTQVTVYSAENGFVQVEFYDARIAKSDRSLRRAWVPAASVSGYWPEAQAVIPPGGTSFLFCPTCGSGLPEGNDFVFCPYCGNSLLK